MRVLILALAIAAALNGAAVFAASNIESAGNLYLVGPRAFTDPLKLYLGPTMDRGLYGFVQERPDGSIFTGLETFKRPPAGTPVAQGYGAYPLRLWGSNILAEENGSLVAKDVVASKLILQAPAYLPGGGITWNPADLGTYLTRSGEDLILYHNGREVARWGG